MSEKTCDHLAIDILNVFNIPTKNVSSVVLSMHAHELPVLTINMLVTDDHIAVITDLVKQYELKVKQIPQVVA